MLRWIFLLAAICLVSTTFGLGLIIPVQSTMQGMLFTLTAFSATLLISSFDAFETQSVLAERDDDNQY